MRLMGSGPNNLVAPRHAEIRCAPTACKSKRAQLNTASSPLFLVWLGFFCWGKLDNFGAKLSVSERDRDLCSRFHLIGIAQHHTMRIGHHGVATIQHPQRIEMVEVLTERVQSLPQQLHTIVVCGLHPMLQR